MPTTRSKKKMPALCLAAALAHAGAATAAQGEILAAAGGTGLYAEIAALWDGWKPLGASLRSEPTDPSQTGSQNAGEPALGGFYEPTG